MNVVELTQEMVSTPSVSGNERGCVDLLAGLLPEARVVGRNGWAVRGDGPRT